MADKANIIREKTFKEEGWEVDRRIFYTLSDDTGVQAYRNAKALAFLVKLLREKDILSEEELDDLLFDCVR